METDHDDQSSLPDSEGEMPVSEIQEYLDSSKERRRLFPRAALVGILAGGLAVFFRLMLAGGEGLRMRLIVWAHQFPLWGWVFPVLLGMAGAVAAALLVLRVAPEASGSGIPHLKAVLHRLRELHWARILPTKLIGGVMAISSGMALGREGPTVQMGAAAGDVVSRLFKMQPKGRLILIAAGAGAGLSAAFNAPLAGLIFVLEEAQRDFRPMVFGAALIAALTANLVTRLTLGAQLVFGIPSYPTPPLTSIPAFVVLGVLAGLLGVVFNRSLLGTLDWFARFRIPTRLFVIAALGGVIGLVGWFAPISVGMGHTLTEHALEGRIALLAIPGWFLLRFALTQTSYGTGVPGGIFAPLLVLGALLGLAVGHVAHAIWPQSVPDVGVFAVVGMAAYFTGIVRAPLTGVVLILEMTGNYDQMLPVLLSSFSAYIVAEMLKDLPVYEALLERDLRRGGMRSPFKKPAVLELEIKPGAPFDGRTVNALGLPPGCLLVRCVDGNQELVPRATTRLQAHMRITAVISANVPEGLKLLHQGCGLGNPPTDCNPREEENTPV